MFKTTWKSMLVATGLAVSAVAIGAGFFSSSAAQADTPAPSTPSTPSATSPDANAIPWPNWTYGEPTDFEAGARNGWYFWYNADGFHLCSTTPSDELHPFRAVLTTGGSFFDISKTHLEHADDIDLRDGGHTLVLTFHTHDGIDCATFRTDGNRLRLKLQEYGFDVPVNHIFVGHDNTHPASDPFAIER